MKLAVIIPAWNEEKTIVKVIRKTPNKILGFSSVEVIVVDDGSKDNTASLAKKAGAMVVKHNRNRGYAVAFRTGLDAAMKAGAGVVVNIDADMQFNPQDIPKLTTAIVRDEADMVTASRLMNAKMIPVNMPKAKIWGNRLFTGLINLITGERFYDTQCGFRAYSQEAVLRMNLFGTFNYSQELFIDLVNKGMRIKEVPVEVAYFKDRKAKLSKSLAEYGCKAMLLTLRSFRDYKPLMFFGAPGAVIFVLGWGLLIYSSIYFGITGKTMAIRMYMFTGGFLVTFGFLILVLAMIADMFKRIKKNLEEVLYLEKKRFYFDN
jgi:glycosyltransferase involved in cell wall biosynthesis